MASEQRISCLVCGYTRHRFVNHPRPDLTMMKCNHCGAIFVVPLWKSEVAKDVFANLDGWPGGIVGGAGNRGEAMDFVAQTIHKCHPQPGRLLDIGCANGMFFDVLRRTHPGLQLYGTDADPRWTDFDYGDAEVRIGNLQQARFPDQHFDIITVLDALYYVPDIQDELHEIARILKPGGLFVFDIPNQAYLQLRGLFGYLLHIKRTRTFVAYPFYFSDRSIHILLNKAGIEISDKILDRGAIQSENYLHVLMSLYVTLLRGVTTIYPPARNLAPKTLYVGYRSAGTA